MDRQIPNDIDIMLEQAEIDSDRIVVIQIAQIAVIDELANLANGAGIDEGVIDMQNEIPHLGRRNQCFGFFCGFGQRFFDKNVLSRFQGFQCQPVVAGDRRRDGDGIDARIRQQRSIVSFCLNIRMSGFNQIQSLGIEVADRDNPRLLDFRKITD